MLAKTINFCNQMTIALMLYVFFVIALPLSCSDKGNDDPGRPHIDPPFQAEIDVEGAWSPDGSKIIYFRNPPGIDLKRDTSWEWGVSIHDLSTGRDSVIWPEILAGSFAWSPDGKQLAIDVFREIYITDLQRSFSYRVPAVDEATTPRWSRCGDKISYCVRTEPAAGLYYFDLSDSTNSERLLTECAAADWSGGCDSVAVKVFLGSMIPELGIFRVSTGSLQTASSVNRLKGHMSASPNGESILVTLYGDGNPADIWRLDLGTMSYTQLTFGGGDYPAWSPDGQWVLYTKIDKENGYLWLMRPDGSEKHQISF